MEFQKNFIYKPIEKEMNKQFKIEALQENNSEYKNTNKSLDNMLKTMVVEITKKIGTDNITLELTGGSIYFVVNGEITTEVDKDMGFENGSVSKAEYIAGEYNLQTNTYYIVDYDFDDDLNRDYTKVDYIIEETEKDTYKIKMKNSLIDINVNLYSEIEITREHCICMLSEFVDVELLNVISRQIYLYLNKKLDNDLTCMHIPMVIFNYDYNI